MKLVPSYNSCEHEPIDAQPSGTTRPLSLAHIERTESFPGPGLLIDGTISLER